MNPSCGGSGAWWAQIRIRTSPLYRRTLLTTLSVHPQIECAFHALNEAGVRWCLLRGEAELVDPRGDVDLLVDLRDRERCRAALCGGGFLYIPARGHGPHAFFVCHDPDDDRWLKLDIVSELRFGAAHALSAPLEAGCLARCKQKGSVARLADDDAFWTLLLHCLLDKRTFPRDHAARLLAFVEGGAVRVDSEPARLVAARCPAGWSPTRIVESVGRADWSDLVSLATLLARSWASRQRGAVLRNRAEYTAARVVTKVAGPARPRGLSVALLAPDGAGKSTVATGLQGSFIFPVVSIYMGLYPSSARRERRASVPGLGLARRLGLQWARWLTARVHLQRGRFVVFDRYSYDSLLPRSRPLGSARRAAVWLLGHACPPPDLVVVLDAPAEVLFERKGEHGVEVLEQQRQGYLELARRLPNAIVVDAGASPDRVRCSVTGAVWAAYVSRSRRGNQ